MEDEAVTLSPLCCEEFSTAAEFELYGIGVCIPIHSCGRNADHDGAHVCAGCLTRDDDRTITESFIETAGMFAVYGVLVGTAIRIGIKIGKSLRNRIIT